tara:strand:+ start:71 stop:970 length:900 start_codon:yes stop_codon:yes gene_type:complete
MNKLIHAIMVEDLTKATEIFESVIEDKVNDMLEAMKFDLAQSFDERKLDPVGKEDDDIDNDGDSDDSDEYLKNRRKTIKKAIKKEEFEQVDEMSDKEKKEREDFKPHMMYDPKTGKGFKANTFDDHLKMKKKGFGHDKPDVDEGMMYAHKGTHYFKGGKPYNGPVHKMPNGQVHTGKTHSKDSKQVFHSKKDAMEGIEEAVTTTLKFKKDLAGATAIGKETGRTGLLQSGKKVKPGEYKLTFKNDRDMMKFMDKYSSQVAEGIETQIAKEKEQIARSNEKIKSMQDREERRKKAMGDKK